MLWVFQGHAEVEALDVKAYKTDTSFQQHTVDHQLDESKRPSWGCNLTLVKYVSPCNCDARPVGVVFLRLHFADNTRVIYVSLFVKGSVFIPDHLDSVCPLHLLFLCTLVSFSNALAQAPTLICIGYYPFLMASQLAEFKGLSSFFIQDKHECKPWRGWAVPQVKKLVWVRVLCGVHASAVEVCVSGS